MALIALAVGPRGVAPSSRGAAQRRRGNPRGHGAQPVEKSSPRSLPYDPLDCRVPLALVEHGADGEADLGCAAQWLGLAGGGGDDLGQIALGGGEQVLALAGAFSRLLVHRFHENHHFGWVPAVCYAAYLRRSI